MVYMVEVELEIDEGQLEINYSITAMSSKVNQNKSSFLLYNILQRVMVII
jgi:hypothetical protein